MTPYPGTGSTPAGRRNAGSRLTGRARDALAWAGVAALVVAAAVFVTSGQKADALNRRDEAHCLVNRPTPVAVLTLLDQTDTLGRDAGKRFDDLMAATLRRLPRNGRLTIVPFGGDLGQSLASQFSACSPGKKGDADPWSEAADDVQWDYENTFLKPLSQVSARLLDARPSGRSPIAEQIERAVSDTAIMWEGQHRELVVMTDGLQFTAGSPIYTGGKFKLPDAPPALLRGVTVRYVELANPTHSELQTAELRKAWEAWFIAAGAEKVIMVAPGYARLEE